MITNVHAIVLWTRRSRDADKVVSLYTPECGRLTVRAVSAAKSTAKFACLTEPFVHSELAVHRSSRHHWGKLVGGHLIQSFPNVRVSLEKATTASWLCEVVSRLTADEDPQPELFTLLKNTLQILETATDVRRLRLAFMLRFLKLFGLGLTQQPLWQRFTEAFPEQADQLHYGHLEESFELVFDEQSLAPLERLVGDLITQQLNRPLAVNRFRQLAGISI